MKDINTLKQNIQIQKDRLIKLLIQTNEIQKDTIRLLKQKAGLN